MKNIFILSVLLSAVILSGCKDDEKSEPALSYTIGSDAKFEANIDGAAVKYTPATSSSDYVETGTSSLISTTGNPSTFEFSTSFGNFSKQEGVDIRKGTLILPDGGIYSHEQFIAFFNKGEIPFLSGEQGMTITYYANDTEWSTENGSQANSTFTLSSVLDESSFAGNLLKYVASFNCTLYDDEGNAKELTGGKCVGYFGD